MITQEYLKSILHYNKLTRDFTWLKAPRNGFVGDIAGSNHNKGNR